MLAAEITTDRADWSQLAPMITAAVGELERAGVTQRPKVALADSQYWNEEHIDEVITNKHIEVLIPPDASSRKQPRRGWTGGRYDWMRTVLNTDQGRDLYRRRIQQIEPVFAHTKHNRQITHFHRRGRSAVGTEWRLLSAAPAGDLLECDRQLHHDRRDRMGYDSLGPIPDAGRALRRDYDRRLPPGGRPAGYPRSDSRARRR